MSVLQLKNSPYSEFDGQVLLQTEEYGVDMAYIYQHLPQWTQSYPQNKPFPHIVIDNFLRPESLRQAIDAFPSREFPGWLRKKCSKSYKFSCSEESLMPLPLRGLMRELASQYFLQWISKLTGIEGLVPDPYLCGSGLFRIEPGGFLKVHADFNMHPLMNLDRRVNLLLYLNEDWLDEYGGHLELWQKGGTQPESTIAPIANRCVIFSTTDGSFHGHPRLLTCPPERSRNCISVYYYSNGRPAEEKTDPHSTIYIEVPPRV